MVSSPDPPSGSNGRAPHRGPSWRIIVRTICAAVALVALVFASLQGIRTTTHGQSADQTRQWERDAAYWNCLTIQAHSLVKPGERVEINRGGLAASVTLEKVVGGWTSLVTKAQNASAILSLEGRHKQGSCRGTVVVEYAPGSSLHGPPERVGSGASDGSGGSLPSTPL
jgi:hypothetical protein